MKLLITAALFLVGSGALSANELVYSHGKEKEKKEVKREKVNKTAHTSSRNFHSIKKWKMRIEYVNGDIISKTIEVAENSSLSAMETAFMEAEKYIKTLQKVRGYEVLPISSNRYVLLAND